MFCVCMEDGDHTLSVDEFVERCAFEAPKSSMEQEIKMSNILDVHVASAVHFSMPAYRETRMMDLRYAASWPRKVC